MAGYFETDYVQDPVAMAVYEAAGYAVGRLAKRYGLEPASVYSNGCV